MSARSTGTAVVSFGLVAVPVKLYSAAGDRDAVSFCQINPETGNRVNQLLVDAETRKEVDRKTLKKGYVVSDDQILVFDPAEIDALAPDNDQAISLTEFVPVRSIDPRVYEKPYFLAPQKGGERGYALLHRALAETGVCGVGTFCSRGKQHLGLIMADANGLILHQIRYASQVRSWEEIPVKHVQIGDAEVALAKQIIAVSAHDGYDDSQYEDIVQTRLKALVEARLNGTTPKLLTTTKDEPVLDLMAALQASLGKVKA